MLKLFSSIIFLFSLALLFGQARDESEIVDTSRWANEPFPDTDIKILVLIIASDNLPVYIEEQKVWRAYMHLNPKYVESYFIKADPHLVTPFEIDEDVIRTRGDENLIPGVFNKTLLAFEALYHRLHEFKYVIRTNLSSFYVFPRLIKFLETLPRERCYAGYFAPTWKFTNGHGIILSSDLVALMLQNENELFNNSAIDDRAIGAFLHRRKIPMLFAPYFDMCEIDTWNMKSDIRVCKRSEWHQNKGKIPEDVFLFRTKNHKHLRATDEVFHQHELLKMFYGKTLPE
jgi:hypothetical protein